MKQWTLDPILAYNIIHIYLRQFVQWESFLYRNKAYGLGEFVYNYPNSIKTTRHFGETKYEIDGNMSPNFIFG